MSQSAATPADKAAQKMAQAPHLISPTREVWLSLRANRGAMAGLAILFVLAFLAIFEIGRAHV